eukprot:gene15596-17169_t
MEEGRQTHNFDLATTAEDPNEMLQHLFRYQTGVEQMENNPRERQMRSLPEIRARDAGRIKPRRSVIDIKRFHGEDKEDVTEWLANWNRAVRANAWKTEEEKVMIPLYLEGRANQFFRNLPESILQNPALLKQELEKHFNSPSQRSQAKHLIGDRYQRQNEGVAEFYDDICKLVHRAWCNKSVEFRNKKCLEYFVKGLKPTIKKIFWGEEIDVLDEAYQKARTRELYLQSKSNKFDIRAAESDFQTQPKVEVNQTDSGIESQMQALLKNMQAIMKNQETLFEMQLQNFQSRPGPFARRNENPSYRKPRWDVECWNCGEKGHFRNRCPRAPQNVHQDPGDVEGRTNQQD